MNNYEKDIIFVKNNEYLKIYYNDIAAIKNIIPYTKKLTNAGYKCHYISGCSKL